MQLPAALGVFFRLAKHPQTHRNQQQPHTQDRPDVAPQLQSWNAFQQRADYIWANANIGRMWTKPRRWYRQLIVLGGGPTPVEAYAFWSNAAPSLGCGRPWPRWSR